MSLSQRKQFGGPWTEKSSGLYKNIVLVHPDPCTLHCDQSVVRAWGKGVMFCTGSFFFNFSHLSESFLVRTAGKVSFFLCVYSTDLNTKLLLLMFFNQISFENSNPLSRNQSKRTLTNDSALKTNQKKAAKRYQSGWKIWSLILHPYRNGCISNWKIHLRDLRFCCSVIKNVATKTKRNSNSQKTDRNLGFLRGNKLFFCKRKILVQSGLLWLVWLICK